MQLRVVHFLNQFFGGLGGEEMANEPVSVIERPVGPGVALQQVLGSDAEIVATIICGDNYFNEERTPPSPPWPMRSNGSARIWLLPAPP